MSAGIFWAATWLTWRWPSLPQAEANSEGKRTRATSTQLINPLVNSAVLFSAKINPPHLHRKQSPLERQVHRQLQEAVAADRLPDYSEVGRIRSGRTQDSGRVGKARERTEAAIQGKAVERRVETGLVEDVEGVGLQFEIEALIELKSLEKRDIETRLERRPEKVAAIGSVAGFEVVGSGSSAGRGAVGWGYAVLAGGEERDR